MYCLRLPSLKTLTVSQPDKIGRFSAGNSAPQSCETAWPVSVSQGPMPHRQILYGRSARQPTSPLPERPRKASSSSLGQLFPANV